MCAPRAIEKPVTLRTRSRVGRWAEFIVDEYRIMRTLWTLWPSGLRRQIKENTRRNYGKNNARDASRARARFRTMREQSQRNILVRKGVGSNPTGVNPHVNFCSSPVTSCVIFFGADHGAFVLDGATAHHAAYRAQLVEWILDACAGERYGPTTADVAIGYMVRGRCDATRSTVSPPAWLADSGGGGQGRSYLRRDRPRCSDERRKK